MAASARITKAFEGSGVPPEAGERPDLTGKLIGGYRLVRRLGDGGMGTVYEAAHVTIGRRAAIKVLSPELARDAEVIDRFFNEARAVNIIQHPDIVNISELSQLPDGTAYLVMEYLPGEPLSQRMARVGVFPLGSALRLVRQIAQTLAAVHDKGIVHRDLKPDNVMIVADPEAPGGERPKILDFGIAKLAEQHHDLKPRVAHTRAGMVLGTPVYMAPEQCRGAAQVDAKADVYSLGVVLYQMLVGRPPFEAEGEGELLAMHIYEEAPPLSDHVAVPERLSELVSRMLDKNRESRPSMKEVVAALGELGADLPERDASAPPRSSGPKEVVRLSAPQAVIPLAPPPGTESRDPTPTLPPVAQVAGAVERPRRLLARLSAAAVMVVSALTLGVLALRSPPEKRPVAAVASPKTAVVEAPAPAGQRVRWTVITEPPGMEIVRRDSGEVLAVTPYVEERPAAPGVLKVLLRRPGFEEMTLDLDLSANVLVRENVRSLADAYRAVSRPKVRTKTRPRPIAEQRTDAKVSGALAQPPPAAQDEVKDFEEAVGASRERDAKR